jgi:hypothetical protein
VSHVAITGSLRQATAFTVGAALRMVTSTDVAVMQRGALWTSDTPYDAPIQPTITEIPVGQGNENAIAIEIATPIAADVHAILTSYSLPVSQLIVLGPPGGAPDNAIANPEDAAALAVGIRDAARRAALGSRVHPFPRRAPWASPCCSDIDGTASLQPPSTKTSPRSAMRQPSP